MAVAAGRTEWRRQEYLCPNLDADVEEIVRPDELAYRLARDAPETVAIRAGRLAVRRMTELLQQGKSFAVETTLAGRLHLRIAERAKSDGWSIGVVYIGLGSSDLAIERVRERVSQGGHNVPAAEVRRRYERSLSNLAVVYDLADRLIVLDNSSARKPMKRLLEVNRGSVAYGRRKLPKWLSAALRRRTKTSE